METLTPEIQRQIHNQIMGQKMAVYGRQVREMDGKKYLNDSFNSFSGVKTISEFVELEKGCETWLEGERYPMRGIFQSDRIATVSQFKRFFPLMMRTFKESSMLGKVGWILYFRENFQEYVDWIHWSWRDVFMEESKYTQPIREIYRIVKNEKWRDIICAILEFDTAYRRRFQDIAVELDKDAFSKNPIKELKRLVDILKQREQTKSGSKKSLIIIDWIFFYLRFFNRKLLKELKETVSKVNVEEIRPSIEDIYWEIGILEYDFRGLPRKEREELYLKLKEGK